MSQESHLASFACLVWNVASHTIPTSNLFRWLGPSGQNEGFWFELVFTWEGARRSNPDQGTRGVRGGGLWSKYKKWELDLIRTGLVWKDRPLPFGSLVLL